MSKFVIQGGVPLSGMHQVPGNKNAALPMLAACLLTDEPLVLDNVPIIEDVRAMLDILVSLGVDVAQHDHQIVLQASNVKSDTIAATLCNAVRSSLLFAGPMVARHGRVSLAPPGGDVIGRRRIDTHFDGLRQLGVVIESSRERYCFSAAHLQAADLVLDEASVTATENVVMAAVLAPGTTTLFNAACEPHVQDLCLLLNKMGARITGIGTNLLTVQGVTTLHGTTHSVSPDYVEAASFVAAAAATGGSISLCNIPESAMKIVARSFLRLGIEWSVKNQVLCLPQCAKLEVANDFGAAIPKIEDGVWPGCPSDILSVLIVLATQTQGTVLFFEKMFESRMYFVDHLIGMGARIVQCDPHRVIVSGPSHLYASRLSSPDIRAGMALIIAALCASGQSIISNANVIDRGYEEIENKLQKLGAKIERTD